MAAPTQIAADKSGQGSVRDQSPRRAPLARTGPLVKRVLGYARPYALLLVGALFFTLIFSVGRYGRAYLIKPVLDDVILPHQAAMQAKAPAAAAPSSLFSPTLAATPAQVQPEEELPGSPSGYPSGRSRNRARGGFTFAVISRSTVVETVGSPAFSMTL